MTTENSGPDTIQQFQEYCKYNDLEALQQLAAAHGLLLFQESSVAKGVSIKDRREDVTVIASQAVPQYDAVCDGVIYTTTIYYELYRQD